MKPKLKRTLKIIVVILLLWMAVTTMTNRFINTELTETQLFLAIPKAFILDFKTD